MLWKKNNLIKNKKTEAKKEDESEMKGGKWDRNGVKFSTVWESWQKEEHGMTGREKDGGKEKRGNKKTKQEENGGEEK